MSLRGKANRWAEEQLISIYEEVGPAAKQYIKDLLGRLRSGKKKSLSIANEVIGQVHQQKIKIANSNSNIRDKTTGKHLTGLFSTGDSTLDSVILKHALRPEARPRKYIVEGELLEMKDIAKKNTLLSMGLDKNTRMDALDLSQLETFNTLYNKNHVQNTVFKDTIARLRKKDPEHVISYEDFAYAGKGTGSHQIHQNIYGSPYGEGNLNDLHAKWLETPDGQRLSSADDYDADFHKKSLRRYIEHRGKTQPDLQDPNFATQDDINKTAVYNNERVYVRNENGQIISPVTSEKGALSVPEPEGTQSIGSTNTQNAGGLSGEADLLRRQKQLEAGLITQEEFNKLTGTDSGILAFKKKE